MAFRERYSFVLTQKRDIGISPVNKNYTILHNGRWKKLYARTCDAVILCGLTNDSVDYFVIPSSKIPVSLTTLNISCNYQSDWIRWADKWDVIKELAK